MHPLLLAGLTPAEVDWPYWLGAAVIALFVGWPTLTSIYDRVQGGTKQREKEEKTELTAWRQGIDERTTTTLPEEIKGAQTELGRQIGENEKKIKANHDANEASYNALALRVNNLEIDNRQLTLLPGQFNGLHTDHKLLAQKVDILSQDIAKLDAKQDKHHEELLKMLEKALVRGQDAK